MEVKMKKYQWIFAVLMLAVVILACAGGPDPEDAPQLAGTVAYEEGQPVTQIEAKEAIQTYAREVVGLDIPDLRAGGKSGELNLPMSTQDGIEVAFDLAGTTYFGVWGQGVASLSFGDTTVSGDLFADVQDGSLGAFAVRADEPLPPDAPTALGLILTAYPGLMGYEFFETPIEEVGFEFSAGKADDIDIHGWDVTLTGTTISAGVRPGVRDSKSVIWVVVASGALAAPFDQ
jgi:hypothetical protein